MAEDDFDTNRDYFSLLEAARLLKKAGENGEALKLIKKALKRSPDAIDLFLEAGAIYQALDDFENAEKNFRQALALNPGQPWTLKSLGLFLASRQIQPAETVELLIRYLKKNGWDDYQTLSTLASINVEGEEKQKVIAVLEQAWASTLSPGIGFLCANQMRLYGRIEEARQIMDLLVKNSPNHIYFNVCGIIYYQLGNFDQAVGWYQKAIENIDTELDENPGLWSEEYAANQNKSMAIYKSNLSGCYFAIKKYDEALIGAEGALKLNPKYGYHWMARVNALKALERFEEAAEDCRQALLSDKSENFLSISEKESFLLMQSDLMRSNQIHIVESLINPAIDDKVLTQVEKLLPYREYQAAARLIKNKLEQGEREPGLLKEIEKEALRQLAEQLDKNNQRLQNILLVLLEGIQNYPHNYDFVFHAVNIYTNLEQWNEAIKLLESVFQAWSESSLEGDAFLLRIEQSVERNLLRAHALELAQYYLLLHKNGLGDTAWDKYARCAGKYQGELPRVVAMMLKGGWEEYIGELATKLIEQIYTNLPEIPQSIQSMFQLRFEQGRLDECIAILNRAIAAPILDEFRLVFLNNLGYIQILQGKLDDARQTLSVALALEEKGIIRSQEDENNESIRNYSKGVSFYLDGKIFSADWLDTSMPAIDFPIQFWHPATTIEAVKCNLVTLALAKGDIDEASALIFEIMSLPDKDKSSLCLRDLLILIVARFRNEQKTAQVAWKNYLRHRESSGYESEEIFKEKHPELHAWLTQTS